MKIAVTSRGKDLDAEVDPRFGRAAFILIIDTETLEVEAINNSDNVNAFKGAGIQAASAVCEKGAEVLLTGYCGPKAFEVIKAGKVKLASDITGSVREAVQRFNDGQFTYSDSANADAHW